VTLLIVRRAAPEGPVIELHGWLAGSEIAEFKAVCGAPPLPFRIELANLVGASSDGVLALQEQVGRGINLAGASPHIKLLLRVRSEGKKSP
jgi:hypothetical protein